MAMVRKSKECYQIPVPTYGESHGATVGVVLMKMEMVNRIFTMISGSRTPSGMTLMEMALEITMVTRVGLHSARCTGLENSFQALTIRTHIRWTATMMDMRMQNSSMTMRPAISMIVYSITARAVSMYSVAPMLTMMAGAMKEMHSLEMRPNGQIAMAMATETTLWVRWEMVAWRPLAIQLQICSAVPMKMAMVGLTSAI